jgi:hypothetical protein
VAAAVLTLAAAAVAAVAITRERGAAAPGSALWEPEVGALTQQQRFPELGLLVRSPAQVVPDDVAAAFRQAWGAFATFLLSRGISEAPPLAVQVIAVVPRAALCKPSTYSGVAPPLSCGSAVHAFRVVDQTLVVVDEQAEWARAMRLGIPEAVCAAGQDTRFCDLAAEFAPEAEGGEPRDGGSGRDGEGGGQGGTQDGAPRDGAKESGRGGKARKEK